jgi:hypothetical protein
MKKQIMTIALVLGLCMTALAQQAGGGLLNRGESKQSSNDRNSPYWSPFYLPEHGGNFNGDADVDPGPDPFNPPAPLGGGALLLVGFGAAYAMTKRKKEN